MKNKAAPVIIFLFVAVALIFIIVFATNGSSNDTATNPAVSGGTSAPVETLNPNAGGTTGTPGAKTYTLADVAKHPDSTSCWTTVSGGVYDLTAWIDQHPGGPEAILSICGKDGTAAFNAQHGGQRRPEQELATFKIGTLSQ